MTWQMGGAFCRICCNRPSESGDALDSLNKSWPEKQTEDCDCLLLEIERHMREISV